ncbi:MAG: protein-arginine deiminase family protein, partial [Bacteroidota bacterium]
VYQETTLAVTVASTASDTFVLTEERFQVGDYLRVDDEYVKVIPGGAGNTIKVSRGELGSTPSIHTWDTLIYCLSILAIENLHKYEVSPGSGLFQDGPQRRIDALLGSAGTPASGLLGELGSTHVIELPVLFDRVAGPTVKWSACTANVVNSLIADGKAFMSDTHGPVFTGTDYFQNLIASKMTGTVVPTFIDAWYLHLSKGEVHCGSNARREPISTDWWEAW